MKYSRDKENDIGDSERLAQLQSSDTNNCDSNPEALDLVSNNTKKFIQQPRTERQAYTQREKPALLHETRFGKVAFETLTQKQRNQLQVIHIDTLSTWNNSRVSGSTKYLYLLY